MGGAKGKENMIRIYCINNVFSIPPKNGRKEEMKKGRKKERKEGMKEERKEGRKMEKKERKKTEKSYG